LDVYLRDAKADVQVGGVATPGAPSVLPDPAAGAWRTERGRQDSIRRVTGPSFVSSTAMRAPNAPRLAPSRSQKRS
jgi:hypothetical protein